jgi:hypothetical protein
MPFSTRPRVLGVTGFVCAFVCLVCFFVGLWFQDRKYSQSGVPENHYPVQKGKSYYFVSESSASVDPPSLNPISASRYQAWQVNRITGYALVGLSAACLVGAVYLIEAADRARKAARYQVYLLESHSDSSSGRF